jgi:hypothetical protein
VDEQPGAYEGFLLVLAEGPFLDSTQRMLSDDDGHVVGLFPAEGGGVRVRLLPGTRRLFVRSSCPDRSATQGIIEVYVHSHEIHRFLLHVGPEQMVSRYTRQRDWPLTEHYVCSTLQFDPVTEPDEVARFDARLRYVGVREGGGR